MELNKNKQVNNKKKKKKKTKTENQSLYTRIKVGLFLDQLLLRLIGGAALFRQNRETPSKNEKA